MNKAIFLDRDGVIVAEPPYYAHRIDQLKIIPNSVKAIKLFNNLGLLTIVVTNQAGIAKGYFSKKQMDEFNNEMKYRLGKHNAKIDGIYFCPHHPEAIIKRYKKDCNCRKPKTSLIEQAIRDFNIDPKYSYLIGDKLTDISAGEKLGIKTILVQTGHGYKEQVKSRRKLVTTKNLYEAALLINKNDIKEKKLNYTFDQLNPKRVSFIMPTFNRAKTLDKALKKYSKLITKDDELIIVDGGSTDNTLQIIKKYKSLVSKFISEPDKNATEAFNKGILISKGRFIKNLNDDDEIYPKEFEKATQVMNENPEIDLLICGGTKQYGEKNKIICLPRGIKFGKKPEDVFKYGASGVGFIIRKRILIKTGLLPTTIASDLEFALKCIEVNANVKFCRINLYNHPINSNSITIRKRKEYFKDFYSLLWKYTSPVFFLRYITELFIQNHPILLQIVNKTIRFDSLKIRKNVNKKDISWDGKFS